MGVSKVKTVGASSRVKVAVFFLLLIAAMVALGIFAFSENPVKEVKAAKLDGVGDALFTGRLVDNVPTGTGILEFADGSSYFGSFKDGRINGKGYYKDANGRVYEVFFEDGQMRLLE